MLKEHSFDVCSLLRHMDVVLILILMEHAQRVEFNDVKDFLYTCLNPYFNGTCSKSNMKNARGVLLSGLNPYFNGTCSKSARLQSLDFECMRS